MLERATLYAMAHRLSGSAGGLITAVLVATFFTSELQGFYYTFLGLLTLQTFVELGFGELLQQSVSHEWTLQASSDPATRERARTRLAALVRFSLVWYSVVALVVIVGLGTGGALYFRTFASTDAPSWELAWWIAVLATGAGVVLTPVFALLEGANRVETVHGTKLGQAIVSRTAGALAILGGAGLFTIAIARWVSFAAGVVGLSRAHFLSLRTYFARSDSDAFTWRHDIWPLQWKFALSWLSGYLLYSLFTPVLFAFHGPEVAGRMGLTLTAAAAISSAAFATIATKVPRLAFHAATSAYGDMDALFRRATISSLAVASAGAAIFFGGLLVARELSLEIASRFLPPLETALLLVAIVLQQLRFAMGSYLRAHKEEPLVLLSVLEALVAIPVFTLLGRSFGAIGMVLGFLGLTTLTLVPAAFTFEHCRNLWHGGDMRTNAHPL